MAVQPFPERLPARLVQFAQVRRTRRPGAAAVDAVALALALTIGGVVAFTPIGSGDYGQWLMVSRFFSGESIPSYRDVTAVAPFVPVLLAGARFVFQDDYVALNFIRVASVVFMITSFYVATSAIFRSRLAGLIAATLVVAMTDRFLDLVAFGGLLQISSLSFMLLALGAIAAAGRHDERESGWWTAASIAFAFSIYSHAGSVAILLPVTGLAVLLNWPWRERRSLRSTFTMLWPAALVAGVAVVYWMGVLVPANSDYGSNPASPSYRGPDRLYHDLTFRTPTLVLVCSGLVALAYGAAREGAERRVGGYAITSAWVLGTAAVLTLTIGTGAATDYPRFSTPILAPLAVATAGAIAELVKWLSSQRVSGTRREWISAVAGSAVVAALLFGMGPWGMSNFQRQTQGYRLPDRTALLSAAAWIEANLDRDAVVVSTDSREAKWLEGITGRETLFSHPIRYSFRPNTWDRNVAADALVRSTSALTNGYLFAKFTSTAAGESERIPRALQLAVNHDGEYIEVLRFPETAARVMAGPGDVLATLGAMDGSTVQRHEGADGVSVRTTWTGKRRGHDVVFTRTVTQTAGSHTIDIVDEVQTTAPVEEMQLSLSRVTGLPFAAVETAGAVAEVSFLETGRRQPALTITAEGGDATITRAGETLIVRAAGTMRLHVRITAETVGKPISSMAMLYPPQVLEDYNVAAVLLKRDGAAIERQKRLADIGFEVVLEDGPYILLADPRALEDGR